MEGEAVKEFVSKLRLSVCACASPSHPVRHSPLHSPANILACYIDVDILFPSSVVFGCLRLSFAPEMVLLIQLSSSLSFSHEFEFGLVSI